jgi:hypothetical protein
MSPEEVAKQNSCPVHYIKGSLCPEGVVWDPICKCHFGLDRAQRCWQERLDEDKKRSSKEDK